MIDTGGVSTPTRPAAVDGADGADEIADVETDDGGRTVAVFKHGRVARWTHWINVPLLAVMIWSGLRIYWADVRDPYGFGVGLVGWHWFDFLPDSVNSALGLERRLAKGMAWHFTFGWLFAVNGVVYGLYLWRSGEWRKIVPERRALGDAWRVVKHDVGFRRSALPPQGRYNAAQRITYTFVLVLGAFAVLTGLAIYKPSQLSPLTWAFGGYEMARTIHFSITIAFLVFFVVHVLQVARAGWRNFTSMITGYERVPDGVRHRTPADGDGCQTPDSRRPSSERSRGPTVSDTDEPEAGVVSDTGGVGDG